VCRLRVKDFLDNPEDSKLQINEKGDQAPFHRDFTSLLQTGSASISSTQASVVALSFARGRRPRARSSRSALSASRVSTAW
jgi:hypothetical protein